MKFQKMMNWIGLVVSLGFFVVAIYSKNGLAIIGWLLALLSFANSLFGHIVICKKSEK